MIADNFPFAMRVIVAIWAMFVVICVFLIVPKKPTNKESIIESVDDI